MLNEGGTPKGSLDKSILQMTPSKKASMHNVSVGPSNTNSHEQKQKDLDDDDDIVKRYFAYHLINPS
jgi:hypothetical protein